LRPSEVDRFESAPPRPKPQLLLVGDLGVDLVIGPLEHWPQRGTEMILNRHEMRVGGSAGNAALAVGYLGGQAKLISSVGNDALAQWVRTQIAHLDAAVCECTAPMSLSVGVVHPRNERTFLTTRGHLEDTGLEHIRDHIPPASGRSIALLSGVFLMPKLRKHYSELMRHLRALGYEIAIDSGWPDGGWTPAIRTEFAGWLTQCDHLLLNENETLGLAGCEDLEEALLRLSACAPATATIVAKVGSEGAKAAFGRQIVSYRTEALDVFDVVGAGDAFNAGYLLACTSGNGAPDRLAAGCRAAAQIICKFPRGPMLSQKIPTNRLSPP
jgi:ribokinase